MAGNDESRTALIARTAAEEFLYAEADLLDSWRLDEWLALFDEDAHYIVPTTDLPRGDPRADLVFIDDNKARLAARVRRLNSRRAHREFPWSRTRHVVSNVIVESEDRETASVKANFVVYRFRHGTNVYVGRYDYKLRIAGGTQISIQSKRCTLDLEELHPHGTVSILL